jgi:hypothetical protein
MSAAMSQDTTARDLKKLTARAEATQATDLLQPEAGAFDEPADAFLWLMPLGLGIFLGVATAIVAIS